jgi:hypothetical protein
VLGILCFVVKCAASLIGQLDVEMAGGFLFFCFPWSYGQSVAGGSPDEVR